MKLLKRFFLVILILFVLLIGVLAAIPYFFKDQIVDMAKTEINNNVNARVDFTSVGLSLLRSFPDFTVTLKGIDVEGVSEFEGLKLADVGAFGMTLDLMSVIKKDQPVVVESFTIDDAEIYVKVLKDGRANYDIAKATGETTSEEELPDDAYQISLKRYAITDSKITYDDAATDTYMEIDGLNHTGKGNFTLSIYDLITNTKAENLTVNYGGVNYINKAKADIDLTIKVNAKASKYTISDNDIRLNDLKLETQGWVSMPGDDIEMDLSFKAPQTDFKHLLSMIPGAYAKDFDGVKASGKMKLDGYVKGTYNEKKMPAVKLDLEVDNASFQYPDLPMGISEINTKTKILSPGSDLDRMTIDVPSFHMKLGDNPFDATFNLRTPMSDPQVKAQAKGKIDLNDLSKAFPMEGVEQISGLINADVDVDTRMSYIENEQYDKVDMSGDLTATGINYKSTDMPSVSVNKVQMSFSPQYVDVPSFDAKLGKSDIQGSSRIDNILAYFSPETTMKGKVTLRSNLIDANEWMGETDANDPTANYTAPDTESTEEEVFDRFDFTLDADVKRILYEDYELKNTIAKGHFTPEKMDLQSFEMELGNTDMKANGSLENIFDYLYNNEVIKGNFEFTSDNIDLNELYTAGGESQESSGDEAEAGEAPDRFDFTMNANVKRMVYEDYELKNTIAQGKFTPEIAELSKFFTRIGKSDLRGSGKLVNVMPYLYENEELLGNIKLESNVIDVNELYQAEEETTTTASTEEDAVYPLPENAKISIDASIGTLLYDNMEFKNMKGDMDLDNQVLTINDFSANTLKGKIGLNGTYATTNPEKPAFDFNYKMNSIDFQESFKTFNSVEIIAPIMKFIDGIFSTEMNFKGELKKDMSLDYNTLTADGLLNTIDAVVKSFGPLEKIGNSLNVKELKTLKLDDTKNWFEIKDGKFILKPFEEMLKDIRIKGQGNHALTQENMNYKLNFLMPRSKLQGNAAGALANEGIKALSQQAGKLGVNFGQSETINFDVIITGNYKKPKINFKFLSASGKSVQEEVKDQVKEVVDEKVNEVKDKAQEVVDEKVEEAEQVVNEQVDKVTEKVNEEVDKAVDKATETVKDKVGEAVGGVVDTLIKDKVGDKVGDIIGDEAKDKINDLKDKIKIPPFGKKKKKKDGN